MRERVSVMQIETKRPVQFELTDNTRETVLAWVKSPEMFACRFHDRPYISTRQYGRVFVIGYRQLASSRVDMAPIRSAEQRRRRFIEESATFARSNCYSAIPRLIARLATSALNWRMH